MVLTRRLQCSGYARLLKVIYLDRDKMFNLMAMDRLNFIGWRCRKDDAPLRLLNEGPGF
ncbi:hypothetical protein M422DRAFT_24909, partial [Sphaerobolus stellatus SS14]